MSIFSLSSTTLPGLNRIAPVYQGETSECGLACIAMLLQALGIPTSLAQLRERHEAMTYGMSLLDLSDVMEAHGIACATVRFDTDVILELPLPAILHIGGNHFVIAMRTLGETIHIYDPAMGEHHLNKSMLAGMATGYALILDETVKPTTSRLPRHSQTRALFREAGEHRILVMLLLGVMAFATPLLVSHAIDRVVTPSPDHAYWIIGAAFLAATLCAFIFERLCWRALHQHCANTGMLAQNQGFTSLVKNRLRYFSRRTPGEIVERFIAYSMVELERVRLGNTMLCAAIMAAVALIGMVYLQPLLALISAIAIMVTGLVTKSYIPKNQALRMEGESIAAKQNQFLLETIQGIAAWKSALAVKKRIIDYLNYSCDNTKIWRLKADLFISQQTIYKLLGSIELVVTLGVAAPAIMTGKLSFGQFYAFVFIRQIMFGALTTCYESWVARLSNKIVDERAKDLFEQAKDEHLEIATPALRATLSIMGMNYKHNGALKNPLLNNINLEISYGKKIAIVGESGCGKTTLLTLISGLDQPQSGTAFLDGTIVEHWETLRHHCYLQTSFDILFSGSVIENITMFSTHPDRPRCDQLLKELGLHQRFSSLPIGLDTFITDATAALSAGERQRLLVARAIYAERAIGIFDEPTANLDAENSYYVISSIVASPGAAVVVTHDKNHLALFDQVYALAQGQLVLLEHPEACQQA